MHTLPLVVDLDGTLTPTDTLAESVVWLIKRQPLSLLRLPVWLAGGRAAFKSRIAERVTLGIGQLPLRERLVDYLHAQRALGRQVVLATAAHHSIADAVALRIGCFDQVLASDAARNLKGRVKLAAIRARVGERFVYAGDSVADLPIWRAAQGAVLVGVSSQLGRDVRADTPIERTFAGEPVTVAVWLRALRLHQWLKNLLIFVPLFTAFAFTEWRAVAAALLAFAAFSAMASATYLVNDLWDLDADRVHPRKRHRPLASGRIGIAQALGASALLLASACVLGALVSAEFLAVLLLYLAATSVYSALFKRKVVLDVLVLAALYTLRIVAGAVAIGVAVSWWLLGFSVFLFFSLALIKRCAELVQLKRDGGTLTRGRDYHVDDLAVLWPLGVGAGLCAVVVFGLFVSAPETRISYATPSLMWVAALGLMYWQARLWIKTVRAEMHDDPLVFALRDATSRLTIGCVGAAILAARFVPLS